MDTTRVMSTSRVPNAAKSVHRTVSNAQSMRQQTSVTLSVPERCRYLLLPPGPPEITVRWLSLLTTFFSLERQIAVEATLRCPLWVKSRHLHCTSPCPLYPQ